MFECIKILAKNEIHTNILYAKVSLDTYLNVFWGVRSSVHHRKPAVLLLSNTRKLPPCDGGGYGLGGS